MWTEEAEDRIAPDWLIPDRPGTLLTIATVDLSAAMDTCDADAERLMGQLSAAGIACDHWAYWLRLLYRRGYTATVDRLSTMVRHRQANARRRLET